MNDLATATTAIIPSRSARLEGDLALPQRASGCVIFAHGSGSSRQSPRDRHVAEVLRGVGLGTFLFDLMTPDEERVERITRQLRSDVGLLADRLVDATKWLQERHPHLAIGYFGASTGAGAALVAAARLGGAVGAVVSRGGRPDLAGDALPLVDAPTLLLVGRRDEVVLERNEQAAARLCCRHVLHVVPGATHLFEEPGALEEVARFAAGWFLEYLRPGRRLATEAAKPATRSLDAGAPPDASRRQLIVDVPSMSHFDNDIQTDSHPR